MASILKPADKSEFISGGPFLYDFLCVVGGSSDSCRLCQFLKDYAEQITLRQENGRRFLWCTRVLVVYQNRKRVIWEPRWWNRSVFFFFFAFVIYLGTFYIMILLCFNFFIVEGGENHSGNRQNLRETKWRPFFFSNRFGTFLCSTRTVTMF